MGSVCKCGSYFKAQCSWACAGKESSPMCSCSSLYVKIMCGRPNETHALCAHSGYVLITCELFQSLYLAARICLGCPVNRHKE